MKLVLAKVETMHFWNQSNRNENCAKGWMIFEINNLSKIKLSKILYISNLKSSLSTNFLVRIVPFKQLPPNIDLQAMIF